ncbi:septum site-determining protein MinC [Geitlerinema sp. PCC 9228]|uniref:septum site-determining protein MinC n=1 Tax=Geitlerinema sp. PCC 9228 TaxID=111611 RepID=UPI0008F9E32B|nr:septum site-determining protein MinC [Geitlerinema sp. PCC 9228]
MTDEPSTPVETTVSENSSETPAPHFPYLQVNFKSEGDKLLLLLPPQQEDETFQTASASTWNEIWQQFRQRLQGGDRFWQPNTDVHLYTRDRLLDVPQLQAIATALSQQQLYIRKVYTNRRQTAVAAASAGYSVEQQTPPGNLTTTPQGNLPPLDDPLYLQTTVRSGVEIRHRGSVILLGDVNPGGSIVAAGDILVWGRLRGVAHAGLEGNTKCRIMALKMEPTQIRIADFVARAPENSPAQLVPEVAYITNGGIRLAQAGDFGKALGSK